MNESTAVKGQYKDNKFIPDFSQFTDEDWAPISKAITAEVNATFPTLSDLKSYYHTQLVGLWLVAVVSGLSYAIATIILH